jgi:DivIVA domain-containing protein
MTSETMDDLVPLSDDDAPSGGFRHVLRGYDPRQVEDYLDRVEVALNEADERHADDARRVTALEQQVGELTGRLSEAERRASGRPEPASALGERMATMLTLAEQEAVAIRTAARDEAEALVTAAKEQAAAETVERTKDLEKREREVLTAQREAESARLDAQKDAEAVRTRATREAERELAQAKARSDAMRVDAERAAAKQVETARDDVKLLHEQAQREAAKMTSEARRQVDELARQRDGLLAQLQHLQETLAAAMSPLSGRPPGTTPRAGSGRLDPQG